MVQGSNPGVGEISCSHPDRPWSPPSLLYNGYRVSFPGVKRLGRGVDHPPPSSARVKERVELYLYSPSGLTWPVLGRTLPFSLTITAMFWPDKFCHIKYLSLWFAVQVLTTSIIPHYVHWALHYLHQRLCTAIQYKPIDGTENMLKITTSYDVTSSMLVNGCLPLGRACCLDLQCLVKTCRCRQQTPSERH